MEDEALQPALVEAIERLRRGTARTRSGLAIPPLVRSIEAVWLTGGRLRSVDPTAMSNALGLPVWGAPDPSVVAEDAGRALLPHAGTLAVIDLGQSHLKIGLGPQRLQLERPWELLPLAEAVPVDPLAARTTLRSWVSRSLTRATAMTGLHPHAVVFALPCALGSTLTPGSSSYPGLEGDADFVPDAVAAAGWAPAVVHVLNDAELAAVAAGLDPRTRGTLTLVLTLGFGVGGALRRP